MGDGTGRDVVFFTGYAKLPRGITASELFEVVGVGMEIDVRTGTIVDAECTLATRLGRRFFRRLVVGRNIDTGLTALIGEIERRYQGSAQKAIITALKIICEKYRSYRAKEGTVTEQQAE